MVPELVAGASSSGSRTVTVPSTTTVGSYWLFRCADDTKVVTESNETNNCRRATGNKMSITTP